MIKIKKKRRISNPKKYSVENKPNACKARAKIVVGMDDCFFRNKRVVKMKEERRKRRGMSSWLM